VTEEAAQPPSATPEQQKTQPPPPPARPIAQAFAQNLHAVLIGSFTILSSVISALLGYYFGHEDQKRLLALEYDKLRAERTLEITKTLVSAESALQHLMLTGSNSSERYCKLANTLAALKADVAKYGSLPPPGGTLNQILDGLGPLIQSSNAPDAARLDMLSRLKAMQDEHHELDVAIRASWKKDDEIRETLYGDTAAMVRVYYRDRSLELSQLSNAYDKAGLATREIILDNGLCNLEPRWKAAEQQILRWDTASFEFTSSLGLELKPD
jgi:hypothetical protein